VSEGGRVFSGEGVFGNAVEGSGCIKLLERVVGYAVDRAQSEVLSRSDDMLARA
jgi:hypothetical protein